MVLDHVADGPGLLVERAAALHAEVLGHRHLDARRRTAGSRPVRGTSWRSGRTGGSAPAPCRGSGRSGRCCVSAKYSVRIALRPLADARSRPNGFSTITRAPTSQPDLHICSGDEAEQRRGNGHVVGRPVGAPQFLAEARRTWPGPCSRRPRSGAAWRAPRTLSASSPPCFSTLSLARARNWSRPQPALATPMTGTSRCPRRAIACRAGKIFLYARSPVAPKNTSASAGWSAMVRLSRRGSGPSLVRQLRLRGGAAGASRPGYDGADRAPVETRGRGRGIMHGPGGTPPWDRSKPPLPRTSRGCSARLRLRTARNGFRAMLRASRVKLLSMAATSLVVALFVFGSELVRLPRAVRPTTSRSRGPIVGGLFDLLFFTLGGMLVFSTGIILYASLFTAPEARFLLATPARADRIFATKFQAAVAFSSWAFLDPRAADPRRLRGHRRGAVVLLPAPARRTSSGSSSCPGSVSAPGCLLLVRYLPRNRRQLLAVRRARAAGGRRGAGLYRVGGGGPALARRTAAADRTRRPDRPVRPGPQRRSPRATG